MSGGFDFDELEDLEQEIQTHGGVKSVRKAE